jgi:hypothetical protein
MEYFRYPTKQQNSFLITASPDASVATGKRFPALMLIPSRCVPDATGSSGSFIDHWIYDHNRGGNFPKSDHAASGFGSGSSFPQEKAKTIRDKRNSFSHGDS